MENSGSLRLCGGYLDDSWAVLLTVRATNIGNDAGIQHAARRTFVRNKEEILEHAISAVRRI